jgi:uncharacterized Ntn-hydrolase superfamily protein
MKNKRLCAFFFAAIIIYGTVNAQDTFSIAALDTITGEVGSAGASCLDARSSGFSGGCSIISDVHPGLGVIHTQAGYLSGNQNYGKLLMNDTLYPQQILDSLTLYDSGGDSTMRQYGIVGLYKGKPMAAGYTGINCPDYKNNITGTYYSIQGNTLLGAQVLDSMHARFLREPGSLACKLMAAMQGAKYIGADTRCASSGNSSLSSFLRVAKPADKSSNLYINIIIGEGPAGFEPIDSLQTRFNLIQACTTVGINQVQANGKIKVYPNPFNNYMDIEFSESNTGIEISIFDLQGKIIYNQPTKDKSIRITTTDYACGIYFLEIKQADMLAHYKIIRTN